MRLRCRLGWHDWEVVSIMNSLNQYRVTCRRCNATKLKQAP